MSGPYPIFENNANLLRLRANNVTLGSAIPEGDDQSHHYFQSDTPIQSAQVPQTLFSNSSSDGPTTSNPAAISTASPTLHSQRLTSLGHTPAISVNTPATSPPITPMLVPASKPAATHGSIPASTHHMVPAPGPSVIPLSSSPSTPVIATSSAPATIPPVTTVVASSPTPVTSPSPVPYISSLPASSMPVAPAPLVVTVVAPDVQRKFEKVIDLKIRR